MSWQGDERRRSPRAPFPCKIVVGSPIRLLVSHVENISEGGIRVLLEEKLSNFVNVGLELFVEKEKPIKCKGKVMWVQERINPIQQTPVIFDTGIQFINLSVEDKQYLKKLIDTVMEDKE